jgi:hypothetical protein
LIFLVNFYQNLLVWKQGTWCIYICILLVSCLKHSLTSKSNSLHHWVRKILLLVLTFHLHFESKDSLVQHNEYFCSKLMKWCSSNLQPYEFGYLTLEFMMHFKKLNRVSWVFTLKIHQSFPVLYLHHEMNSTPNIATKFTPDDDYSSTSKINYESLHGLRF